MSVSEQKRGAWMRAQTISGGTGFPIPCQVQQSVEERDVDRPAGSAIGAQTSSNSPIAHEDLGATLARGSGSLSKTGAQIVCPTIHIVTDDSWWWVRRYAEGVPAHAASWALIAQA